MPISQIWTLEYLGITAAGTGGGNNGGNPITGTPVTKTLAAWGITGCEITRLSQAADQCVLRLEGVAFDADEIFVYQSMLSIKRSGVVWFQGVVTKTPKMDRPSAEGVQYVVSGPWWWLEQVVYQQYWCLFPSAGGPTATQMPQSHVILFADVLGDLIDTGTQIESAMTYALGANLPLQLGAVGTEIEVPDEAGSDLTIAEVIKRALRWHPDAITWFDYTTSPPTLNIQPRSALAPVSLPCVGAPASEIEITPRYDLQRPVVSIHYRQVNTYQGLQQLFESIDQYPADASEVQAGALVMTVDLTGNRYTWLTQEVTAPGLDANNQAWWQQKLPQLSDAAISNLSVVDSSGQVNPVNDGDTVYGNELQTGSIAGWMTDVHASEANASALFNYDETTVDDAGNTVVNHVTGKALSVKVVTTDATSQTYQSIGGFIAGDPLPAPGLAAYYYNLLAPLQYDGSFSMVEEEAGDSGGPFAGQVLNLTGGRSEWTTMNAQIYVVTENLATGATTLRIGPTKHLSPADMVAHLRAARDRVIGALAERVTGILTGGEQVLPTTHPKETSGKGAGSPPAHDIYVGHTGTPGQAPSGSPLLTVKPTGLDDSIDPDEISSSPVVQLAAVYVVNNGSVQQTVTYRSPAF